MSSIRKYTPLKSLYINDLHDSNFIVNPRKREVYTINLDSCKIGSNLVFPSRYLCEGALLENVQAKYKIVSREETEETEMEDEDNYSGYYGKFTQGYVMPDENTDIYCYIIMILNYLYGENINKIQVEVFYEYLNYLEHIGMNRELILSFSSIVENKSNANPLSYLDTITNEQVFRAKKTIFQKTK